MGELFKAVADVFAAILGTLGFIGKPRLRHSIREDMQILNDLGAHDSFGVDSTPYVALHERIGLNVERLADVEPRKKRPLGAIVIASLICLALAYWTYKLNDDGFAWVSLLPGFFAFLFFVSTIGMIFPSESETEA